MLKISLKIKKNIYKYIKLFYNYYISTNQPINQHNIDNLLHLNYTINIKCKFS